ncbi:hypothetical protein [Candidatus Methylacidithermus pantelleriae]|uniref:hypothetical protein n=1 Tax=Candidatus Methylacidithermus pantelleriae TaxID=2744239 RepID=UPI00157D6593|nr:hypothetical protein [Candidatus Methylacidithermus pantelleriae]
MIEEEYPVRGLPFKDFRADPLAQSLQPPLHPLRGGFCRRVALARAGLVVKTKGVTEKVETLLWHQSLPGSFLSLMTSPIRTMIVSVCFEAPLA